MKKYWSIEYIDFEIIVNFSIEYDTKLKFFANCSITSFFFFLFKIDQNIFANFVIKIFLRTFLWILSCLRFDMSIAYDYKRLFIFDHVFVDFAIRIFHSCNYMHMTIVKTSTTSTVNLKMTFDFTFNCEILFWFNLFIFFFRLRHEYNSVLLKHKISMSNV